MLPSPRGPNVVSGLRVIVVWAPEVQAIAADKSENAKQRERSFIVMVQVNLEYSAENTCQLNFLRFCAEARLMLSFVRGLLGIAGKFRPNSIDTGSRR